MLISTAGVAFSFAPVGLAVEQRCLRRDGRAAAGLPRAVLWLALELNPQLGLVSGSTPL